MSLENLAAAAAVDGIRSAGDVTLCSRCLSLPDALLQQTHPGGRPVRGRLRRLPAQEAEDDPAGEEGGESLGGELQFI